MTVHIGAKKRRYCRDSIITWRSIEGKIYR